MAGTELKQEWPNMQTGLAADWFVNKGITGQAISTLDRDSMIEWCKEVLLAQGVFTPAALSLVDMELVVDYLFVRSIMDEDEQDGD